MFDIIDVIGDIFDLINVIGDIFDLIDVVGDIFEVITRVIMISYGSILKVVAT